MQKTDIDTVTNVILNNEYKLHENEEMLGIKQVNGLMKKLLLQ